MQSKRGLYGLVALATLLGSLATACGTSIAPASPRLEKLVIAVQPTSTPEMLSADARDIEKLLSNRLGREVQLVFPTTFAGVIEALRFGHAHAAFMSAWPAALAQKHAGAEVVLAEVREVVIDEQKVEAPYYFSYWIVRNDSPITSLEQLYGKRVSLPSPLSTSGYVAPLARMVELGLLSPNGKEVDPRAFFGDLAFSGGYAQSWEALKSGQVEATVIAGDVSERLYREVLANTRIIEKQGPIPSHGVVFARHLEEPARGQLKQALLEMGQPEQRDLMRKFISGIFVSFKPTTGEEHLSSLSSYLAATQLSYVERMN